MKKFRLELALELDPLSILDRAELPAAVARLQAQLHPQQWAVLELLALEVARLSAVDRETRRAMLELAHSAN